MDPLRYLLRVDEFSRRRLRFLNVELEKFFCGGRKGFVCVISRSELELCKNDIAVYNLTQGHMSFARAFMPNSHGNKLLKDVQTT